MRWSDAKSDRFRTLNLAAIGTTPYRLSINGKSLENLIPMSAFLRIRQFLLG